MDRQKLLMIFGAAWISAALLTWFLYAKTTAPKTEKTVKIVAAVRDLQSGAKIGKGDIKMVTVAEKDLPKGALTSAEEAVGRAVVYPVNTNEPITSTRLTSLAGAEGVAAIIEPGMRAISVPFTDSTGVSGLIQPRARVDVLFTRSGSLVEAMTVTILEDVSVLSIGRTVEVQQPGLNPKAAPRPQNQTATLMVTPEQARILEFAKNQGKISLALRNPLDRSVQPEAPPATAEQIDPMLLVRSGRRGVANLKDRKAWASLIGDEAKPKEEPKKEPPKPKIVVDVYRGDRHVQEIFQ